MKSQVLSNFQWPLLSIAAFLIFLLFFISVVIWTLRRGTNELYEETAHIPLLEDQEVKNG